MKLPSQHQVKDLVTLKNTGEYTTGIVQAVRFDDNKVYYTLAIEVASDETLKQSSLGEDIQDQPIEEETV